MATDGIVSGDDERGMRSMAKTAMTGAQRQRVWRTKSRMSGLDRIDVTVSADTKRILERLALRQGTTTAVMVERLTDVGERLMIRGMTHSEEIAYRREVEGN
jgi:hypothetical protein